MTDADEIISPDVLLKCATSNSYKFSIHMDFLNFYVNFNKRGVRWQKSMIYKPADFDPAKFDRGNQEGDEHIIDGGWHFEYMGGRNRLLQKINSTSHFIENGARNFWREIYDCTHDLGYLEPYDVSQLPPEAKFLIDDPIFCLTDKSQDWTKKWMPVP